MRPRIDLSGLRRAGLGEYSLRFVFGGLITLATGVLARWYGPETGGLFLAFPAIFPAAVTLVEKHEREKKRRALKHGAVRGREAAALDAAGATIGGLGLIGFAVVAWQMLPDYNPAIVLVVATGAWLAIAGLGWAVRRAS
jgi:uncharacterized protein DUF3147